MSEGSRDWVSTLDRDGFVIRDHVVASDRVAELIALSRNWLVAGREGVLDRQGETYGVRDLLWRFPEVRALADSPELRQLVEPVIGPEAFAVRGLYFDKTPDANWNLPGHQDLTIALDQRLDVEGFGPWTVKAGIVHAHAPAELLGRMVTVRIHLDDCGVENGPMRVLRGSHSSGKLAPKEVAEWSSRVSEVASDCLVPAGGAVIMRPLILHASASATGLGHRRVIHLEYAAESLPAGLSWYGRFEEIG